MSGDGTPYVSVGTDAEFDAVDKGGVIRNTSIW